MSVQIIGNGGIVAEVDEARNLPVFQTTPGYPAAGGFYSVTGFTSAVVAAALAANTALATARFSAGSTRKAFLTKLRVLMAPATPGAAGGIPPTLALQRFTAATPTGGTARTVDRVSATKGSASDMTDVRDSNAALTVAGVTFGNLIASSLVPISGANITPLEWIAEFPAPEELVAGDGVALKTQVVGPATATWVFSYELFWYER